jgi:hypothetical protein
MPAPDPVGQKKRGTDRPINDLGNMFQYHMELGEKFMKARDPKVARELNPNTRDFDQWLRDNAAKITIG